MIFHSYFSLPEGRSIDILLGFMDTFTKMPCGSFAERHSGPKKAMRGVAVVWVKSLVCLKNLLFQTCSGRKHDWLVV